MNSSGIFASERQNVIKAVDIVRQQSVDRSKDSRCMVCQWIRRPGELEWIVNGYQSLGTPVSEFQLRAGWHGTLEAFQHAIGFNIGEMKMSDVKIGEVVTKGWPMDPGEGSGRSSGGGCTCGSAYAAAYRRSLARRGFQALSGCEGGSGDRGAKGRMPGLAAVSWSRASPYDEETSRGPGWNDFSLLASSHVSAAEPCTLRIPFSMPQPSEVAFLNLSPYQLMHCS